MGKSQKSPRTIPAGLRWCISLLGIVLALLLIWLLGFVINDIGDLDGPDYQKVREKHVDTALEQTRDNLAGQIADLEKTIQRDQEIQKGLRSSMDNARSTMQQMMDLHRLSLEKQSPPSETEKEALATSQQRFLEAQNKFEEANARISDSNTRKFELSEKRRAIESELATQEIPAREEFKTLMVKHGLKIASFKLAFVVPIFIIAAWLFFRYRRSIYRPILIAVLAASFWRLGLVMFDHFPREFFKYIAIIAGIITVILFLVWVLRKAARPNRDLLLNRYREAYRAHNCPVCAYPIARGPMRFAMWTKKGPILAHQSGDTQSEEEEPYSCPSCGTCLFEICSACSKPRHSLLPFCEHCGDEKTS